ncbi:hypothetical protein QBC47DRAFT_455684 [Echria macrotheca]|uniref:NAD(P)-binding protein n=1 Tax=Echria macrotheca TaxID=438768 RepID=A0AAJ0B0Y2_9PEZI|nr:hypothetical protein QBC47DRAFT_455684 [Echria macrotheca]
MPSITYSPEKAQKVKGRVIVVTGGAQGIGATTVTLLHTLGAHVVFGDIASGPGAALEDSLKATNPPNGGTVHFRHTDVTSYPDQLALFEEAFKIHGRVDAAISCAATVDDPTWFGNLTLDAVRNETASAGISKMVATNLVAPMILTHLALAFITASPSFPGASIGSNQGFTPSVTFTSSLAGLTPTPGMTIYSSTKHGLVGLTRSLPAVTPTRFNALCPGATDTAMLPDVVKDMWRGAGFRIQPPEVVARSIVQCVVDARLDRRVVVVAGGETWESEEELEKLWPAWLGEVNAKEVEDSGVFFGGPGKRIKLGRD